MRIALLLPAAALMAACAGTTTEPGTPDALSNGGVTATAGSLRLRCEVRGTTRSKVSVDGNNLSPRGGMFSARISSGANTAAAPARAAIGDQAEFDFDSNPADIRAGATAIARNFIQGGSVSADILDASGAVVATASAACRAR